MKRTRERLDSNIAPCSGPSSAHSMDARKCVHAQKPYSCQAFAYESSKVGLRRKRETGKTKARRLMERKAAQQKKNLSEEIKQGLTVHSTAQINKAREKK